ncbi:MAG TPA: hypothetical protein PK919_02355 [Candidatus Aminicenantes bacterium]|nr:hypothetical protein [Candidatus Aminicenantes bacterium]
MENFKVTEQRTLGLLETGNLRDLLEQPDNVFNLAWEILGKRRTQAQVAQVEAMIESGSLAGLVDFPAALYDNLREKMGHLHRKAQAERAAAEQERLRREREAIPRVAK